jgi:hypothetical protein
MTRRHGVLLGLGKEAPVPSERPIAASSNASVAGRLDAVDLRSVEATPGAIVGRSAADAHAGSEHCRRQRFDIDSAPMWQRNLDRSVRLELDRFDPRRQRHGRLSVSFAERSGDRADRRPSRLLGEEDRCGRIGGCAPIGPQPEQQRSRPAATAATCGDTASALRRSASRLR